MDEGLRLSAALASPGQVMAPSERGHLAGLLHAAPQGVRRMSVAVPNVVGLPTIWGVVGWVRTAVQCTFMVRS